ncbi:hypothetical protein GCM10027289_11950 [Tsukamurella serpentis]
MARTPIVIAVAAVAALLSACGEGTTVDGTPSPVSQTGATAPGGVSEGVRSPQPARPTGSATATAAGGAGADRPATAGQGLCLDLASPVVRAAVAKLPAFYGRGYVARGGTDAKLGSCPQLLWAKAELAGGTASSPEWVLFFDRRGYLGTATSRPTAFTGVVGSTDSTVAVSYRWLNPGDTTAGRSGGPVVVTYTLAGGAVTPDRDVPRQAFGDTDAPASPGAPSASSTAPR